MGSQDKTIKDKSGRFVKGIRQPSAKIFNKGHVPWNKGKIGVMPIPWNKGLHYKTGKVYGGFNTRFKCGKEHSNYKGGYKRNLTKNEWKRIQYKILNRDKFTCQSCKDVLPSNKLNVHHIIPFRISKDNSDSNLTTLCIPCHISIEHFTNLQYRLSNNIGGHT